MTILPNHCDPETANNSMNKNCANDIPPDIDNTGEEVDDFIQKETIDEYKSEMYLMQEARRKIVHALMNNHDIDEKWVNVLRRTYAMLSNSHTMNYTREMSSVSGEKFEVKIKDEVVGLRKDLVFLDKLITLKTENPDTPFFDLVDQVNMPKILEEYHPISANSFREELSRCVEFLRKYVESVKTEGIKPIFITDWDGTMKDYCTQYATNLQPIYSAVDMARFASRFTRLSAVLTAGPLRGPGILDLTSLPIDGPIMFSGSWGREWWLDKKRIVHDVGISVEGIDALERFNDEMRDLLTDREYSQFELVGSGVQRKVDRLTLGVQTVCNHVQPELLDRYIDAVRERIHRVDPPEQILYFDRSTELEVEVVVHSDGTVWNKANGVASLIETLGETLKPPGSVLICGDTLSDLPMVQQAVRQNPQGVMAIFVTSKEDLSKRVVEIIGDSNRCCFVACPDVIHASFAELIKEYKNQTKI